MISTINLNQLKVFESVYRTKSMTQAAGELHLTQSGVSQHMKTLEENLGLTLFERVGGLILPTNEADILFNTCKKTFGEINETISQISQKGEKEVKGVVKIGIPIEFGNSLILPKLSELGQTHKKIQFDIKYGFATGMNQMLLDGVIDFAFVDEFKMAPQIETKAVFVETLCLCVLKSQIDIFKNKKDELSILKHLSFVDYQHSEPVLRKWFQHHYGKKSFTLDVRAWAMDVQGLSKFILNGLGAGVLPDYVIQQIPKSKELLYVFKGNKENFSNTISIANIKKRQLNQAAQITKDFLLSTNFV